MDYRTIQGVDGEIRLDKVILGASSFGANISKELSYQMMDRYYEIGGRTIDTARFYAMWIHNGISKSEKTVGDWLRDRDVRDQMTIITKGGHPEYRNMQYSRLAPECIEYDINTSLCVLDLDYVDIFYSHRYDPETPLEETLQALVDIVRQGKALYVGISKYPKEAAEFAYRYLAERDVHCLLYQGRYNMFNREPEEEGILQQARENGTGFIAFSPLAQGLLTNRYLNGIPEDSRIAKGGFLKKEALTEEVLNRIKALNEVATHRGQTLAEMALAWVLKDEMVTSVIIGASSVAQLADNLKAIENTKFTAEELETIQRILD